MLTRSSHLQVKIPCGGPPFQGISSRVSFGRVTHKVLKSPLIHIHIPAVHLWELSQELVVLHPLCHRKIYYIISIYTKARTETHCHCHWYY